MIKLSEEGMSSKDIMGWKLGLLHQTVSQERSAKVLEGNLKSCSSEDVNDKIVKQPYSLCLINLLSQYFTLTPLQISAV